MARIMAVVSAIGGAGKTTASVNLATALALRGHRTVVIDLDTGHRNLELALGCEHRVVYDLVDVIQGEALLHQTLIRDRRVEKLFVLPSSRLSSLNDQGVFIGRPHKEMITVANMTHILHDLRESYAFEYILYDTITGIGKETAVALHFSDDVFVVTTPDLSSVQNARRTLDSLFAGLQPTAEKRDPVRTHLLINQYDARHVVQGKMMRFDAIGSALGIKVVGVIPQSRTVNSATGCGFPVILYKEILDHESVAGAAYHDAVARFLGEPLPMRFVEPKLIHKLLARVGL